jgi:hypothetical protein
MHLSLFAPQLLVQNFHLLTHTRALFLAALQLLFVGDLLQPKLSVLIRACMRLCGKSSIHDSTLTVCNT